MKKLNLLFFALLASAMMLTSFKNAPVKVAKMEQVKPPTYIAVGVLHWTNPNDPVLMADLIVYVDFNNPTEVVYLAVDSSHPSLRDATGVYNSATNSVSGVNYVCGCVSGFSNVSGVLSSL